ncbi:YraN family protein [Nitrospina gracilis]|uniref:YraN family protein n=1 Tax=Nitrospina gracilis TaxID=35801 RepID=UPI001F001186|nr:YraN family protein [Nitrospina gracilis]MCF8720428.1 putative endonuclease [Nitrospina gracilis Nb-211]
MTEKRLEFGREGEAAAVRHLKKQGYRILETNYRSSAGEIDIIGEHNRSLVFIEVKTRAGLEKGHPAEALTAHKQRKIGQVAKQFLTQYRVADRPCRFDVVAITGDPENPKGWKIEVIQDAFRL